MNDLDYAVLLMRKAKEDISALEGMLTDARFSSNIFGFHGQQAVEKCLKAAISARGIQYPLTHSIVTLCALLPEDDPIRQQAWELEYLSSFAVTSRYPLPKKLKLPNDRNEILASVSSFAELVERFIDSLVSDTSS